MQGRIKEVGELCFHELVRAGRELHDQHDDTASVSSEMCGQDMMEVYTNTTRNAN